MTYDDERGEILITLEQTYHVENIQISGTIKINQEEEATANLDFSTEDGQRGELNLNWKPFESQSVVTIEGLVNGQMIRATTPIIGKLPK